MLHASLTPSSPPHPPSFLTVEAPVNSPAEGVRVAPAGPGDVDASYLRQAVAGRKARVHHLAIVHLNARLLLNGAIAEHNGRDTQHGYAVSHDQTAGGPATGRGGAGRRSGERFGVQKKGLIECLWWP